MLVMVIGRQSPINSLQIPEGYPAGSAQPARSVKHLGERRQATIDTLATFPRPRISLAAHLLLIINAQLLRTPGDLPQDSGTDASPETGAVRLGPATSSCVTCGRNVQCVTIHEI
jgi:hypothetical protein